MAAEEDWHELDAAEFADRMNKKMEHILTKKPEAESHNIVKEALAKVVLEEDVSKDEVCCLCIDDGSEHSVTIHHNTQDVCYIDEDALGVLVHTLDRLTGARCFKKYLKSCIDKIMTSSSNQLTGHANRKVYRKHRGEYPKYRIRFKGQMWMDSDEERDDLRVKPRKKTSRRRVMHVIAMNKCLASGRPSICNRALSTSCNLSSSSSNEDNSQASDVCQLTDIEHTQQSLS